MWESERRKSQRASGGQVDNDNEQIWRTGNVAGHSFGFGNGGTQ